MVGPTLSRWLSRFGFDSFAVMIYITCAYLPQWLLIPSFLVPLFVIPTICVILVWAVLGWRMGLLAMILLGGLMFCTDMVEYQFEDVTFDSYVHKSPLACYSGYLVFENDMDMQDDEMKKSVQAYVRLQQTLIRELVADVPPCDLLFIHPQPYGLHRQGQGRAFPWAEPCELYERTLRVHR